MSGERLVPISAKVSQDLKISLTKKAGELGVTVSELVGTYVAGGYSGDYSGTENGQDLALEVVTLMQDHFPVLSSAEIAPAGDAGNEEEFELSILKNRIEELEAENSALLEVDKDSIIVKLPKKYEKKLNKSIKIVQKILKEEKPDLSKEEAMQYLLIHGCAMCDHEPLFGGPSIKESIGNKEEGK